MSTLPVMSTQANSPVSVLPSVTPLVRKRDGIYAVVCLMGCLVHYAALHLVLFPHLYDIPADMSGLYYAAVGRVSSDYISVLFKVV